jgi:hypothetical protein
MRNVEGRLLRSFLRLVGLLKQSRRIRRRPNFMQRVNRDFGASLIVRLLRILCSCYMMFIFARGRKSRLNGQHPGFATSDPPWSKLCCSHLFSPNESGSDFTHSAAAHSLLVSNTCAQMASEIRKSLCPLHSLSCPLF